MQNVFCSNEEESPEIYYTRASFHGISSLMFLFVGLTRDVEESQTVFVQNDGFSVLLRAMQRGDEKLQTKAAFMMKAMCMSKPQFKGN